MKFNNSYKKSFRSNKIFLWIQFILHDLIVLVQVSNNVLADISVGLGKGRVRIFDTRWCASFTTFYDFLLQRNFSDDINFHVPWEIIDCIVVQDILMATLLANDVRHVFNDSNYRNFQCPVHFCATFRYIQGSCLWSTNKDSTGQWNILWKW